MGRCCLQYDIFKAGRAAGKWEYPSSTDDSIGPSASDAPTLDPTPPPDPQAESTSSAPTVITTHAASHNEAAQSAGLDTGQNGAHDQLSQPESREPAGNGQQCVRDQDQAEQSANDCVPAPEVSEGQQPEDELGSTTPDSESQEGAVNSRQTIEKASSDQGQDAAGADASNGPDSQGKTSFVHICPLDPARRVCFDLVCISQLCCVACCFNDPAPLIAQHVLQLLWCIQVKQYLNFE